MRKSPRENPRVQRFLSLSVSESNASILDTDHASLGICPLGASQISHPKKIPAGLDRWWGRPIESWANQASATRGAEARRFRAAGHPQSERGRPPRHSSRHLLFVFSAFQFVLGIANAARFFRGTIATLARECLSVDFRSPLPSHSPFPLFSR